MAMFGMRSQANPNVRAVQEHSESLIGLRHSAGTTASRRGQPTDSGRHHVIASRSRRGVSAHNLAGTRCEVAPMKRQKPHYGHLLLAPSPDADEFGRRSSLDLV